MLARGLAAKLHRSSEVQGSRQVAPEQIGCSCCLHLVVACTYNLLILLTEQLFTRIDVRNPLLRRAQCKMSASTKETLAQADIILNRTNVALARSQRLIASWLPPKDAAEPQSSAQQDDGDDDDFRGDSEIGGIGSAAQRDDSGMPDGAFKRRKLGANDKLLESLLGKKAANAHRKSQQQSGRGGSGLAQSASKPLSKEQPRRQLVEEDSDEDEGGRAATFKSKKSKAKKHAAPARDEDGDEDAVPRAGAEELAERAVLDEPKPAASQQPPPAAGKKRPASYLDELLAQKASKKSKKRKKSAAAAQAA